MSKLNIDKYSANKNCRHIFVNLKNTNMDTLEKRRKLVEFIENSDEQVITLYFQLLKAKKLHTKIFCEITIAKLMKRWKELIRDFS